MNAWYLSDGFLVGRTDDIRTALAILETDCPSRGLSLREEKAPCILQSILNTINAVINGIPSPLEIHASQIPYYSHQHTVYTRL